MFESRLVDSLDAKAGSQRHHLFVGERRLEVPRQACRRIQTHNATLIDHLIFHRPETIEPFVGLWNRPVKKLIVIAFGFLKKAVVRLKAIEVNVEPFPFVAPAAFLSIECETSYSGLVTVGVPVHAMLTPDLDAGLRRALLATLAGARQRARNGCSLAVLLCRVARQASGSRRCRSAQ